MTAGSALLAMPWPAQAQPAGRVYRVGVLIFNCPGQQTKAFKDGLQQTGYTEGRNLRYEERAAASHVDRILKGTKTGEIQVEQPAVFEPVPNQATTRTLGLPFPQALLGGADRVIESP